MRSTNVYVFVVRQITGVGLAGQVKRVLTYRNHFAEANDRILDFGP